MMRWLVLVIFAISFSAKAEPYRRLVNFEWEPIEGASSYEIEIRKKGQKTKSNAFKSMTPEWNGRLQIGHYEFRLRSLDQRKVPGEWSDFAELDVMLEPVKMKSPTSQALIKAESNDTESSVKFEWEPVPGAEDYHITVKNDINEVIAEDKTDKTSWSKDLPVAKTYSFSIQAVNETLKSEAAEFIPFTLVGPALSKSKIEKPENEFVRELKWTRPEFAENFDLQLLRYNPTTKKWQKISEQENYSAETMNFEPDWPGGKYRFQVKAKANIREPSEPAVLTFDVRGGDRSPAAEYVTTMRKSIDRTNGWFTHLSWYASSIALESSYKNSLSFGTNSVTGTGRFGGGWLDQDRDWGFLAIADVGGFIFENAIYNYVGLEVSAIRKQEYSERADFRYHIGVFTKEFPALWTTSSSATANFGNENNNERNYGKGNVAGPHIGAEFWYSITPKLGLQGNFHMYVPMIGLDFPNGGKLAGSDPNITVGALASYRYSNRLTGLVGVNYRMESYTYTDPADRAGWLSTPYTLRFNDNVQTILDGVYLNLMAEYAF